MKIDLPKDVIEKILKQDSEMLATHVVANRILGSFREEAKLAMTELMRRRMQDKDKFAFEEFIREEVKSTNIDLKLPSVQEIKREIIGSIVGQLFSNKQPHIVEDISEDIPEDGPEDQEMDEKTAKDLQEVFEQLHIITS
ncbi:MAG TPA: hypothetical protein VMX17_04540 [Candidatus Glassbacteria bacterium]|nr:hypothetical protein [Candidatus Glassbacteria bacterium]